MNIAIKINRLLDDLYPDRTMTVYLKTLKSEIEKLVDSENKLQNKDLIAYLKIKGYSKFADSFETPIPKAVTEAEETDFNLDDIFTSKEYEKEINSVKNYNSHRHNGTLFEKLSTAHDEEIIEQLVRNNQSLVHKVAARYQSIGGSHSFEDLVNEGNIGLLKAISKYDITLGYEFSTYAVSWIRQTITRSIMDHGNIVRVPVHMHETIAKIKKIEREIIDEFQYI